MLKKKVKKVKSLKYWQKKADAVLQEIGRLTYDKCLICGGAYSTLHHFIFKSQSTELRYNMKNCIPVCNNCHCSIHQGVSSVKVGEIINIKGLEWFEEIKRLKKQGIGKYYGRVYFENMYKKLNTLLNK
jgi:hypothetical protein